MRWATVPAGGAPIGSPRPPRRDPDGAADEGAADEDDVTDEVDADGAGAGPAADDVDAGDADDAVDVGDVPVPAESGAPSPAGGVPAPGPSAQRLTVRAGGVPRGAGRGADPEEPGAETGGAVLDEPGPVPERTGREAEADAAEAEADADDADRCSPLATGAGAVVSGRDEGVTVAAGETDGNNRSGASATGSDQAPEASHPGSPAADPAADAAAEAARRWTGRVGIGACEVRLGTAGFASTRPTGAEAPVSWPSGVTIGGSGWWPGTASRNRSEGATRGGPLSVRWMGGSWAQAPVGAASSDTECTGAAEPAASAGPSGAASEGPSDGVLRPNGHGRRTGVTPPRTGAC